MRRPISVGGGHQPSLQLEEVFRSTAPTFARGRPQSVFDVAMHRHLTFSDFHSKRNEIFQPAKKAEGPKVLFLDLSKNRIRQISLGSQLNNRQHHSQNLQGRQTTPLTTDSHRHFLRLRQNSQRRRNSKHSELATSASFFQTMSPRRSPKFFRDDFRKEYEERIRATPIMQPYYREQQSAVTHKKPVALRQQPRQLDLENAVIGVRLA